MLGRRTANLLKQADMVYKTCKGQSLVGIMWDGTRVYSTAKAIISTPTFVLLFQWIENINPEEWKHINHSARRHYCHRPQRRGKKQLIEDYLTADYLLWPR